MNGMFFFVFCFDFVMNYLKKNIFLQLCEKTLLREFVYSKRAIAILKQSHYSIANHVSFFIRSAQADARIKILTVEYLLDWGHRLLEIDASLNTFSLRSGGVMQTILLQTAHRCKLGSMISVMKIRAVSRHTRCVHHKFMKRVRARHCNSG